MSHHRRGTDSPDISLLSCSRLVTPSCISYYLLLSIGTNSDGLQSVSLWSLIWRFSQSREEWEMDSILFYLTRTLASEDQTPNIWEAISPQILTRRATTTITLSGFTSLQGRGHVEAGNTRPLGLSSESPWSEGSNTFNYIYSHLLEVRLYL